jgi:Mg/Co/Ni transporter MgtE
MGWDASVVVNDSNVVLGILRRKALESDPNKLVGEVMVEGPSTYRPNVSVEKLVSKLDERNFKTAIVTNHRGELIGMFEKRSSTM